ncbi:uncharacterized protein [Fopius arisanus]|uniref:Uncharacterized protein n=1 Tax=Fopius arisanus TaxID=64838 RepID=A0A0C9RUH2_9HYME|nr:PREDICTED: uncharacterized protein LOC105268528 [Fopius arisanus]
MATCPATWIRQNMFSMCEENRQENSQNRILTEAEVRVKKSLEKLSIPEWYINNCSKPPKILVNGIAIENRPAPWKGSRKNSSMSTLSMKNSKETTKSAFSDAQNFHSTHKLSRKHHRSQGSSSKFTESSMPQNGTLERKSSKQKNSLNTSGTFPRMSVSRKIQNINIVFPPAPKLDLSVESLEESKFSTLEDSNFSTAEESKFSTLEESKFSSPEESMLSALENPSESKSIMVTDLDDPDPECLRIRRQTYTKPNDPKSPERPECSISLCRTPDLRSSFLKTFKVRTSSTPEGSPVSVFSTSSMASPLCNPIRRESIFTFPGIGSSSPLAKPLGRGSPEPLRKPLFFLPPPEIPSSLETTIVKPPRKNNPKTQREKSPAPESERALTPHRISPRPTSSSSNYCAKLQLCDKCKADNVRISLIMVSPVRSPRTSPTFSSPLMPITEDQRMAPGTLSRHSSNASSHLAFIMSKNKSTAMEKIIKKKRVGDSQSLIQDIIEELQEKCRSSPQRTYTSPGSRNFVRKLVRVLEKSDIYEDNSDGNREAEAYSSEDNSDADIKSVASSTSLSFKDSDSGSESGPRSPTLSSEPDYDWMAKAKDEEKKLKEEEEEEEESVFWVPVKKSLPRSSSLISMMTNSGRSPSISPIRVQRRVRNFQWNAGDTWGSSYQRTKRQLHPRLFRIDESGVVDSGYSDRSERSSATDAGVSWSDFESVQSPSDIESFSGTICRTRS